MGPNIGWALYSKRTPEGHPLFGPYGIYGPYMAYMAYMADMAHGSKRKRVPHCLFVLALCCPSSGVGIGAARSGLPHLADPFSGIAASMECAAELGRPGPWRLPRLAELRGAARGPPHLADPFSGIAASMECGIGAAQPPRLAE